MLPSLILFIFIVYYTHKNFYKSLFLLGLLACSIIFIISSKGILNSLADISSGPQINKGNCKLILESTKYANYYRLIFNDIDEDAISINSDIFYKLKGDMIKYESNTLYECKREVEIVYLKNTNIAINIH